jgi:fermentation-respiration switch protein FrsA (DUF1100 family)
VPRTDTAPPRRRRLRRLVLAALVAVAVFHAAGGWYFANEIERRALDGAARRASTRPDPTIEVLAVDEDPLVPGGGGTITLRLPSDSEALLARGVWGLRWEDGYGQVAGIVTRDGASVTRAFLLVRGGPPEPGELVELDLRAWPDAEAAGLPVRDVEVPGPLGTYPAWFVPGRGSTWAIVVHGNSMVRTDGIRLLTVFARAGLPALAITYRNDVGAPADPSDRLAYGLTEWADLQAAVRYALAKGARSIVLAGYSMGGGIIMAFLQRSELADRVRAVVLDAPMLDLSATVDDNATRERLPVVGLPLPPSITWAAKTLAGWRFGVDWERLDYLADVAAYRGRRFLVLHGTRDETVPIATSERLRGLLPEQVRLVRCRGAGHIECWNLDPEAYAAEVLAFLRREA